ncbi:hypothetical protein BJ322DRAFT_1106783 [Thelephora terrestris]|uniref:Uncharacterized protein n=1 Tax=Thelephora terrestris TaxID=56493 RepID=A0A9P6HGB9_9AGAM|nr:hypothetical protein BJ322DRAFT_1106783 [Thelephora terrestris]
MTWCPSDAKGNPLPPFGPLDAIDRKGGLFPSIENDSPWTFEEVKVAYPSTKGIWESVREVWRLSTFEELGTGDRTWTVLVKAWIVRHYEVCREAGVQPYGPVVEYLRHVVQRNLISGEGLPSTEVKALKTPKTGRPSPRAKLPYVLVPPSPVPRIPKRKEVTPDSPTTTTRDEETEAMDEEWKETQGSPPTPKLRSLRGKGQKKVKRETKKETPAKQEKEKTVIAKDMSDMKVLEDSRLSPGTKKLFPTACRECQSKKKKCVPLWRKYYLAYVTVWCEYCMKNKCRCSFTDEFTMLHPPSIMESLALGARAHLPSSYIVITL